MKPTTLSVFFVILLAATANARHPLGILYYSHEFEENRAKRNEARLKQRKEIYDERRPDQFSHRRAGFPLEISRRARPSDTGRYVGYYVGGGGVCFGHHPAPNQGTWGWDYYGMKFKRKIFLLWNNRYQGGMGQYQSEGPRPVEHLRERKAEAREHYEQVHHHP
ncbi:MAG: hypothetical protein KatS3mg105_1380 [Gemmatales bacterium]|nr:MAG: hypothetical protein KatS3mg105_1380 [Gemmatales bacterium]